MRLAGIMSVRQMLEPQRCLAVLRLPAVHERALCALHVAQEDASGDAVTVVVATAEGNLYTYTAVGLRGHHGPKISLDSETLLWQF